MHSVILKVPVLIGTQLWMQATNAGIIYSCLEHLRGLFGPGIGAYDRIIVKEDLAACEFRTIEGLDRGQEWGLCLLDYLTKMGHKLTTAPQVSFEGEHIIMCIYVLVKED